jgi:DNA-binding transcriptional LysR family regulator
MINLEWYRIFLHTARHRNLTKAALDLHITQPSVSYAIKQLEAELGIKLFHRLSKGVELTEDGKALLSYVEPSFSLLHAAEKHVEDLKQLSEGEIRVGASDSLIKHLLLPHLNQFHKTYPRIRIRLSHGKTPDIIRRLKEGQIDCAVIHLPIHEPQLKIHPIALLEDCFVVGEAYRELADHPLSASELMQLPLLLLSPGSHTREYVEQWFAARGLSVTPDIELGSIDLLAEFARLNYGAAFITRSFVQEELDKGQLYELQLEHPLAPRQIGFAVPRDTLQSHAADRFIQMMIQESQFES